MTTWNKKYIETIIEKALGFASADQTTVVLTGQKEGATRFAGSEITQNIVSDDLSLNVQSAFGKSVGTTSTNLLTEEALEACVKKAEDIARLSPADPEYMPPVNPVKIPEADTWNEKTAGCSPTDRAKMVSKVAAATDKQNLEAAGSLTSNARVFAMGNSLGHFAYHRSTGVVLKCSATSQDSVGYAKGYSRDVATLDVDGLAAKAVDKAVRGKSPRDLKPGKYDVILEPAAVGNLLGNFFYGQMSAKATDQGRTFFSDKRDADVVGSNIHVFSDPTLKECPSRPFDWDGAKIGKVDWLKDKKVANLIYSRYWAAHKEKSFTGYPGILVLRGENTSLDKMIRATKRGLLVTRVWYIVGVDHMKDLYTGTTRDGTFYIENGEIAYPVKNLRFNDSVVRMLANVEHLGTEQNTPGWPLARVPAMTVKDFNFTSGTKF